MRGCILLEKVHKVCTNSAGMGGFDLVLVFVRNTHELAEYGPSGIQAVKQGGILWLAYQKISARAGSDITRDTGWDVVQALGWDGVSLIAIDSAWSALRFKPGVSRRAARIGIEGDQAQGSDERTNRTCIISRRSISPGPWRPWTIR
jgi:hypothetical protein